MSDSDSEQEYEYYDYGRDRYDEQEIIVAGGDLMNGNAYATVKEHDNGYISYREYGKHAFTKMYTDHEIQWGYQRCDTFRFNIVESVVFRESEEDSKVLEKNSISMEKGKKCVGSCGGCGGCNR